MARSKTYYYLVDNLTSEKAGILKSALLSISAVKGVSIKIDAGLVTLDAVKDIETELRMACDVAGTIYRMKVSRKQLH